MAEIIGSAVASESVSRIFSTLSGSLREQRSAEENAERLEFAVLKIQSLVAVSEDWLILHQPLITWKARLKRVAKEGDDILRAHKRRSTERGVARKATSVRKRISRFMLFCRGKEGEEGPSDATVRRFERLAGVADEFFRCVQFGGRLNKSLTVSFKVPMEPLLEGKTLEFSLRKGSLDATLLLHPCDGEAGGPKEIVLFLSYDDTAVWEKNVKLFVVFRLLENTDILNVIMSALQVLPPQFGDACVSTRELAREVLPAQETSYSIASCLSTVYVSSALRCHRNSTDQGRGAANGEPQLPSAIIRVDAVHFAMPQMDSLDAPANDGMALRLFCHVTPHLVPERYSQHYEQIGEEALQELLPKVAEEGAPARARNWWCPRTSTYLSVEPELSMPPPTLEQLFLTEACREV
ncbi:unnamed protein product [Alopecurus aequalis]